MISTDIIEHCIIPYLSLLDLQRLVNKCWYQCYLDRTNKIKMEIKQQCFEFERSGESVFSTASSNLCKALYRIVNQQEIVTWDLFQCAIPQDIHGLLIEFIKTDATMHALRRFDYRSVERFCQQDAQLSLAYRFNQDENIDQPTLCHLVTNPTIAKCIHFKDLDRHKILQTLTLDQVMNIVKTIHNMGTLDPLDIPKLCKMVGFNSAHENNVKIPVQTLLNKTPRSVHQHVVFLWFIS